MVFMVISRFPLVFVFGKSFAWGKRREFDSRNLRPGENMVVDSPIEFGGWEENVAQEERGKR